MFDELKVLVCGDICLDIIEDGEAHRISPEAPVPVILNPSKTYSLGMAGNVMMNLKFLGADVEYMSLFYGDRYGLKIQELLKLNGFKEPIQTNCYADNATTIVKKRIFANGQQIARVDREKKMSSPIYGWKKKLDDFIAKGIKFDAIVISDYNKGAISKESLELLNKALPDILKSKNGVIGNVYVDSKKSNALELFNYANVFLFPNQKEADIIFNYYEEKMNNIDLYLNVVKTMSDKGAEAVIGNEKWSSPAFPSQVVDVCGCGDTFMSAFLVAYTKFNYPQYALDFANYCCSKVIKKKGTVPVLYSEVNHFWNLKK